jgi:hypothetical protein
MSDLFEEILAELDPDGEWETDGFGMDSNLVHSECGTMIEQDAKECPVCHVLNPIRAAGLI